MGSHFLARIYRVTDIRLNFIGQLDTGQTPLGNRPNFLSFRCSQLDGFDVARHTAETDRRQAGLEQTIAGGVAAHTVGLLFTNFVLYIIQDEVFCFEFLPSAFQVGLQVLGLALTDALQIQRQGSAFAGSGFVLTGTPALVGLSVAHSGFQLGPHGGIGGRCDQDPECLHMI